MANLRIIYDNAADRAAISASSTAGALIPENMQNDLKGQIHRSEGTSVVYTLQWSPGDGVSAVVLPVCNLSATATIRVILFADEARNVVLADSGVLFACPGLDLGDWEWSVPINANSFIYGGYSKTAVYFEEIHFAAACEIHLEDAENPAGYIDCSRVLAGVWWSPQYNAGYGVRLNPAVDQSVQFRNDAGDLLADRGSQHETLSVPLPYMVESDRARLAQIFRYVGTAQNFFLSLYPGNGMSPKEQDHMVYGKRTNDGLSLDSFNKHSSKIEMEGW
ncbi:MAG: hypothetical protein JWQ22_1281 [Devosia sp.]|nr:hypothetical protein [Devosia sp.]